MKRWCVGLVLGFSLACGGFGEGEVSTLGTKPGNLPNPDRKDPAEIARLSREYSVAVSILEDRVRQDPNDHKSYRMLGDVNLSRGQDFAKKWKENLGRAYDAYGRAVALQPENCSYWARLASVVAMSSQNDVTRVQRLAIEKLPIDQGWEHCAGPAILELEVAKAPTEAELESAKEQTKNNWEQLNIAAPWLQNAFQQIPLDHVTWSEGTSAAKARVGGPVVVLKPPLQARGQGHERHRPVASIEKFRVGRLSEDRVIFTDRRFPARVPASGVVLAPACRNTVYNNNGKDGVATGHCSTSSFIRGKSALYSKSALRVAGPGHYAHASIKGATIPGEEVIWDSVKCTGGKVQRKLEYTPTCPVSYDKPNWLTRYLPKNKVVAARDDAHADQLMTAAGMETIWGENLTERMVRGDVGVGMPYALFRYAKADLKGCLGRAVLARHRLNGGDLEFSCRLDGTEYTFVDLQLVWFGPVEDIVESTP